MVSLQMGLGVTNLILLPAGTSIVFPVGYMNQPTYRSSPHIPLEEVMWQAEEEVYSDNILNTTSLIDNAFHN